MTLNQELAGNQAADQALLRRFEPIVHCTQGESFLPMSAETYVRYCSLWREKANEDPVCLVPAGELTLARLADISTNGDDALYYLKFIDPLKITQLAAYRLQDLTQKNPKPRFHTGRGRLARVGYVSRIIDAAFTLGLLARGRVPGDTAAAAIRVYQAIPTADKKPCYYGRVIRRNGWVILQYWFLYAFNNWRSGFNGANDHEADWEMIIIYLAPTEHEGLKPEWAAYASHDFSGDDLRRRWDDPEVQKWGEHPIIFAGAGSHASYFQAGEYLPMVEVPFLATVARAVRGIHHFWQANILQKRDNDDDDDLPAPNGLNLFRIPFVDFARGDGLMIGPGQEVDWDEPRMLDPTPAWALNYRGLWGLYARDPFSGENAPAGPLYNRNGTMRRSWYDPLGWAGLDKILPPQRTLEASLKQQKEIENRQRETAEIIVQKNHDLIGVALETTAIQGQPHLKRLYDEHTAQLAALTEELRQLRQQAAADNALREALVDYTQQLRAGKREPARAHIRHAHQPASEDDIRLGRIAETWAAISIGLLMISTVLIFVFSRQYFVVGLMAILALFIFIEAGARKSLVNLITNVTNLLATITALLLIYQFFWAIVMTIVLLAGLYVIWENVRELWV